MRILKICLALLAFIIFGAQITLPQDKPLNGCVITQTDNRWYFHSWVEKPDGTRTVKLESIRDDIGKALDDCKKFIKTVPKPKEKPSWEGHPENEGRVIQKSAKG